MNICLLAVIRQNYNEIAEQCGKTAERTALTSRGRNYSVSESASMMGEAVREAAA